MRCAIGHDVIKQGDAGDNFFVVDGGQYHVLLSQVDNGKTPVHTYEAGGE